MKKILVIALILMALLLTACGGSEPTPAPPTKAPTETPAPPPTATAAPEPSPEADADFPPGTRLETIDPLAANGENNIVLLASGGDALVVGVEPEGGPDIALGLFLIGGSGEDRVVSQANAGPGYESLVHTFQIAGAYRLAIKNMNATAGGYKLRIASSAGVALYVNPRHSVQGKLESNDHLSYLHNGYADQVATISVTPAEGSADLDLSLIIVSLRDLATVLLEVDDSGPGQQETAIFRAPSDDEYLVTVRRQGDSVGIFTLKMTE